LQLSAALMLRAENEDDPLVFDGVALMPTFDLVLPAATNTVVRFFVTLYPDSTASAPASLELQLLRDGSPVGNIPIPLPPPDAHGEIRYVGDVPTRTFPAASYTLRLVARQGARVVTEEAPLTIGAVPTLPLSQTP
jgi:hypothetical protein